jgi:hypothetical protein
MRYHVLCCIADVALCRASNPDYETDYPKLCSRCLVYEAKDNYCPLIPHDCDGQREGRYGKQETNTTGVQGTDRGSPELLEANLLKTEMLPDEASPSAWETIRYLKGYSDALNDVAECFARMIERLKSAEEE